MSDHDEDHEGEDGFERGVSTSVREYARRFLEKNPEYGVLAFGVVIFAFLMIVAGVSSPGGDVEQSRTHRDGMLNSFLWFMLCAVGIVFAASMVRALFGWLHADERLQGFLKYLVVALVAFWALVGSAWAAFTVANAIWANGSILSRSTEVLREGGTEVQHSPTALAPIAGFFGRIFLKDEVEVPENVGEANLGAPEFSETTGVQIESVLEVGPPEQRTGIDDSAPFDTMLIEESAELASDLVGDSAPLSGSAFAACLSDRKATNDTEELLKCLDQVKF